MLRIPQSATIRVPLQGFLASDHLSPATGLTIAVTISKNGAAYGNPSAGATNATAIANGSYYVDLSTTDTGTVGPLFVRGTATGMDPITVIFMIAAMTDQTGDSYARLGTPAGASVSADLAAVKAILPASGTIPNTTTTVPADVKKVNGTTVTGSGTAVSPWGP